MRNLATGLMAAVVLVAACTACSGVTPGTQNVGQEQDEVFRIGSVVLHPRGNAFVGQHWSPDVGATGRALAIVRQFDGPYSLDWNFGGGAEPNSAHMGVTAGGTSEVLLSFPRAGTYQGYVFATDADNPALTTGAFGFSYTVLNQYSANFISLNYREFDRTIRVRAETAAGFDSVLVSASRVPDGMTVRPSSQEIRAGETAVFEVAADILAGAGGDVGFVLSAPDGGVAGPEATVEVSVPPYSLPPDTLVATPLKLTAAIGEPVRIVIATGWLPESVGFAHMALSMPSDASLIQTSANIGSIGGGVMDPDGIWATTDPGSFISPGLNNGWGREGRELANGRRCFVFDLGGAVQDAVPHAQGAIVNAEFVFSTPGRKTISILSENPTGRRTGYWDSSHPDFHWGDISNDGSLVPNSVVIN